MRNTVRFDWALKRLLRNKANYGILEGFLSELLHDDIKIDSILESESNKQAFDNKLNRVDMLVQNTKGEFIIIEFQNNYMSDYLMRMLFGTSKIIIDFMNSGMPYSSIKKIISINILFFDLCIGTDYIYHGITTFSGINDKDLLQLGEQEQAIYYTKEIGKIYPEYYIIKVNEFNNVAKSTLEEWINFFKTEEVKEDTKAKGLKQAKETLEIIKLPKELQIEYYRDMDNFRDNESGMTSNFIRGEIHGRKIEREIFKQKQLEIAKKCLNKGMSIADTIELTGLSEDEIKNSIN